MFCTLRSAVLRALSIQGASTHCVAVLAILLQKGEAHLKLGPLVTDPIHMDRGVPQGAPESPMIFIQVVEMVLMGAPSNVERTWKRLGL